MILTFPRPYPDELLYSLFARYQVFSGNTSNKTTLKELYGGSSAYAVIDLPGHLNIIAQRLGPPWTAEALLFNHTLYPYYAYFHKIEKANKVKDLMCNGRGDNIHSTVGINGSKLKPKTNLWVCEDCIRRDLEVYGETYWRRVHQLPYVFFCIEHGVILSETPISKKKKSKLSFVAADPTIERKKPELRDLSDRDVDLLFHISKLSVSLLLIDFERTVGDNLHEIYMKHLNELGYTRKDGFANYKKLHNTFNSTFSEKFLREINFDSERPFAWLHLIFRKSHYYSFHPTYHLILALFISIETSRLSDKLIDLNLTEIPPLISLNELYPILQREVLKVNDTETNIPSTLKDNSLKKKLEKQKTTNRYKEKWLFLLEEHPGLSRSELRKKNPRIFTFLRKFEQEWFEGNSPPEHDWRHKRYKGLWEERDQNLLERTIKLIDKWDEGEDKIVRITVNRIGIRLGNASMLNKHIKKLPKTKRYIDGVLEDYETFTKRRVEFILTNAEKKRGSSYPEDAYRED